jgi:hypothetical protein
MTFAPGKSGNPGGRPKLDAQALEVKELAKTYSTRAIERLAEWLESSDGNISLKAALALLERAWGKPVQPTELTGKDGGPIETADLTDNDMARRVGFILAKGLTHIKPTEH